MQLVAALQPVATIAEITAQLEKTGPVDIGFDEALGLKHRLVAISETCAAFRTHGPGNADIQVGGCVCW